MKKTQRMIEQRRKAENYISLMENNLAAEKRSRDIANFEVVTTRKIDKRTKQERFERLKRENELSLLSRRRQVADMYNQELEEWKTEMFNMQETQADRKARIMERAYALRDAREAERQKIVAEAYNLQWRDSCDDARTLDSKALDQYMNEERLRQISDKKKRNEELSANENEWVKEWNAQLAAMSARDQAKADFKNQKQQEMVSGLRDQMQYNQNRKRDEFMQTRKEDNEEIALIRKQMAEERALQQKRTEDARQRGREVLKFNAEQREIMMEESKRGAVEDAILLNYALTQEAAQIEAEEAKKKGARQAAALYKKYLEEQMLKEAQDEGELDAIRKAEEEKVWKARDDVLEARRVARANLMKLVDEGRQEQISKKRAELELERREGEVFAQKFVEDAKQGIARERAEVEARRQVARENNEILKRQIASRERQKEVEKQETYLEDKQMQYMERLHKEKLHEQAGSVRLNFPLSKNNWYT